MNIVVILDVMLVCCKMKFMELVEEVGILVINLFLLKIGKVKGICFVILVKICVVLDCMFGDIF